MHKIVTLVLLLALLSVNQFLPCPAQASAVSTCSGQGEAAGSCSTSQPASSLRNGLACLASRTGQTLCSLSQSAASAKSALTCSLSKKAALEHSAPDHDSLALSAAHSAAVKGEVILNGEEAARKEIASKRPADVHFVAAAHSEINFYGRWERGKGQSALTDRGATYLRTGFTGSYLAVKMQPSSAWWRFSIDDGPFERFQARTDETMLAYHLNPGKHQLLLVRDTEGADGISVLDGFILEKGAKLTRAPKPLKRRIEFVGDSVLAGAFADGPGNYMEQENGYMSFGPQLARLLQADWSVIATSGEGVVRNMSEEATTDATHALTDYQRPLYNRLTADNKDTNPAFKPQLIIVNQGANDFEAKVPPTSEAFIAGYKKLIRSIRQQNPRAVIVCLEPVPYDSGSTARPLIEKAVEELQQEGLKDLHFLPLNHDGPLLDQSDLADGEHPLISGHTKVALNLQSKVARIMDWS